MNKTQVMLLSAALCCGTALAEKADSTKEMTIFALSANGTNVRQIGNLVGKVEIARGTLLLKSGKANVKEDPEGYTFVTLMADPGEVATFRQKRDGGDLWVEGQAERIEYDDKSEVVKLFSRAKLTQLEGTRHTDEVAGEYISYDSKTENFSVANSASGQSKSGDGRVKFVIQPKVRKPAPAAASAASTPGKQ